MSPTKQKTFQAVYYRAADGTQPVRAFIDEMEEDDQAIIENQIDRLNILHDGVPHLPYPHSSQVEGELRELRCHVGSTLYRILYRRSDRLIVLLHILKKKTKKIPEADKKQARDRWKDFKERMDAEPRKPPRAAGSDAP